MSIAATKRQVVEFEERVIRALKTLRREQVRTRLAVERLLAHVGVPAPTDEEVDAEDDRWS
jgi:hypothetical protein